MAAEGYRTCRQGIGDLTAWLETPWGADLSIDGAQALGAAGSELFASYSGCLDDVESEMRYARSRLDQLQTLEAFVEACASVHGEAGFWPALGVALCAAHKLEPAPLAEGLAVVNDSLLLILSPTYRQIRFTAYNQGIRVRVASASGAPFRPETRLLTIDPAYLITGATARVQQYNVNHDLVHIVLFGDCYVDAAGTVQETTDLLVNAEETSIALDLRVFAELARFGVELHHLREIEQTESGWTPQVRLSLAREVAASAQDRHRLEAQLKHVALCVARGHAAGCHLLRVDRWVSLRALRAHAKWCHEIAERNHRPAFRRAVAHLSPSPAQRALLRRAMNEHWSGAPAPAPLELALPDPVIRATNVALYAVWERAVVAADSTASGL
jgi:hypothetical protein